jgi:hypothetical protein
MVDYEALYQTGKDIARGIMKISKVYVDYAGIIGREAHTKEGAVYRTFLGGYVEGMVYGMGLAIRSVELALQNPWLVPLLVAGCGASVAVIRIAHGLYEFNKKVKAKSKEPVTQA